MISTAALWIFLFALATLTGFFVWSAKTKHKRGLLHNLFLLLAIAYASWLVPLIAMYFVDARNVQVNFVLDCLMQPGGALCSPLYLCIAVVFVTGEEKLPKWMRWVFLVPVLTIIVAWTNPLHHLYYVNFSTIRSEIVFGPYILVSGVFSYVVLIGAVAYVLRFGIKKNSRLNKSWNK